ncbi:uncharacterized protein LOC125946727 [Dermacentor silvarum]|uniref:uncharacterized protein LOC125946727 n=1 Tax=Dermacentor silvarum TaxID=543639 RepID=UPI0021015F7C|nr:uncharacterized protein LOC125946727 [Dermacentor silvarum]
MAAPGGFILHQVLPFCAPAGYTPRGYRGGTKGFHTEGALTHVFCLVGSAVPVLPSACSMCAEQNVLANRLCWRSASRDSRGQRRYAGHSNICAQFLCPSPGNANWCTKKGTFVLRIYNEWM